MRKSLLVVGLLLVATQASTAVAGAASAVVSYDTMSKTLTVNGTIDDNHVNVYPTAGTVLYINGYGSTTFSLAPSTAAIGCSHYGTDVSCTSVSAPTKIKLYGNAGNDILGVADYGTWLDTSSLYGGAGDDTLGGYVFYAKAFLNLHGNDGSDFLFDLASDTDDWFYPGGGDFQTDTVWCGAGNDNVIGVEAVRDVLTDCESF